jgi:hypothetical protein
LRYGMTIVASTTLIEMICTTSPAMDPSSET